MTRPAFPVAGLTRAQRSAFEQIAIGEDRRPFRPKTIARLKELGAIEETWELIGRDRFGLIRVPRYSVPTWLHIAWCEWCSK